MNRKILVVVTTVLVIVFAGYGVIKSINDSNADLSEFMLANIEVLAQNHKLMEPDEREGGGGCSSYISVQNEAYVIYMNMKKRFLSSNCKIKCGYTCRVRIKPIDYPPLPDIKL